VSTPTRNHPVCVGNAGEDDVNTIVLGGYTLVIPLELDLDDDPLQDDEVRLRSEDGCFERVVKASDPEAEPAPDERLLYYHFHDVPPGAYRIEVNVAGRWSKVLDGIVVKRTGPVVRGAELGAERPQVQLGSGVVGEAEDPPEPDDEDEDDEPDSPDALEYMDLAEGYEDAD